MRSLAGMSAWMLGKVCVATLLAQIVGLGYLWLYGIIDSEKVIKVLAVVYEVDSEKMQSADRQAAETKEPAWQLSYEEVEKLRAIKSRHLDLKAQALESGLEKLRFERQQLAHDKERHGRLKTGFDEQLAALRGGAKSEGVANVRQVWETIKPKLAKEQIMTMLERDEIEDVVVILSDMPIGKRGKIISQFTTPEEVEAIDQILRLIRKGAPEITLIDATRAQSQTNQPTVK